MIAHLLVTTFCVQDSNGALLQNEEFIVDDKSGSGEGWELPSAEVLIL